MEQVGSDGDPFDLTRECARSECRTVHQLFWLKFFCDISQSIENNSWKVPSNRSLTTFSRILFNKSYMNSKLCYLQAAITYGSQSGVANKFNKQNEMNESCYTQSFSR
jgi:hypothetical protein